MSVVYQINIEPRLYTIQKAAALMGATRDVQRFKSIYVNVDAEDIPLRLTYIIKEYVDKNGEPKVRIMERVSSIELYGWMIAHTKDISRLNTALPRQSHKKNLNNKDIAPQIADTLNKNGEKAGFVRVKNGGVVANAAEPANISGNCGAYLKSIIK